MSRFLCVVLLSLSVFACSPAQENSSSSVLEATQVQELLQKKPAVIVLDVRTPEEFVSGHLNGAQNLDFYQNFDSQIATLDKEQEYLVYCAVGGRSSQAAQKMKDLGLKVSDLQGGIKAWESAGLPLEK